MKKVELLLVSVLGNESLMLWDNDKTCKVSSWLSKLCKFSTILKHLNLNKQRKFSIVKRYFLVMTLNFTPALLTRRCGAHFEFPHQTIARIMISFDSNLHSLHLHRQMIQNRYKKQWIENINILTCRQCVLKLDLWNFHKAKWFDIGNEARSFYALLCTYIINNYQSSQTNPCIWIDCQE